MGSHTAPYKTDSPEDGTAFLKAFLQDANIDMISPQLYSEGDEQIPEFDATGNCAAVGFGWKAYENMRDGMKLVPSIVEPNHYPAVKLTLEHAGLAPTGYFVWMQSGRRMADTIIV